MSDFGRPFQFLVLKLIVATREHIFWLQAKCEMIPKMSAGFRRFYLHKNVVL